jgi:hypothetical protein
MIEGQQTNYEWVVEPVDKYQDIIEVHHFDKLSEALGFASASTYDNEVRVDIALKKDVWFDAEGLQSRHYNYIHLSYPHEWPSFDYGFEDGSQVPKKYLTLVNRYIGHGRLKELPDYVLASLKHAYEYEEVV